METDTPKNLLSQDTPIIKLTLNDSQNTNQNNTPSNKNNNTTLLSQNHTGTPQNIRKPLKSHKTEITPKKEQPDLLLESSGKQSRHTKAHGSKKALSNIFGNKRKKSKQIKEYDNEGRPIYKVSSLDISHIDDYLLKPIVDFKNPVDRELMINVMQKPVKTVIQIQFLKRGLESTEFFGQEENKKMLRSIPPKILGQCIELKYVPKRGCLFHQGDKPDNYYILLNGEVYTFIKKSDDQIIKEKAERKIQQKTQVQDRRKTKHQSIVASNLDQAKIKQQRKASIVKKLKNTKIFLKFKKQLNIKKQQKLKQQQREKQNTEEGQNSHTSLPDDNNANNNDNFAALRQTALRNMEEEEYFQFFHSINLMVKLYRPGESFGELALITKRRRAATMECKEDSYLLALSKTGFDLIVSKFIEHQNGLKISFLRSFSFFKNIPYLQLVRFLQFMQEIEVSRKKIVFSEQDKCNYIYLIKQGEIEISKLKNVPPKKNNKLIHQKQNKIQPKKISLFLLGEKSQFGGYEIIYNLNRQVQAECYSETASLYRIKKEDFTTFLTSEKCFPLFQKSVNEFQTLLEERELQVEHGNKQIQKTISQNVQQVISQPKHNYQYVIQKQLFDKDSEFNKEIQRQQGRIPKNNSISQLPSSLLNNNNINNSQMTIPSYSMNSSQNIPLKLQTNAQLYSTNSPRIPPTYALTEQQDTDTVVQNTAIIKRKPQQMSKITSKNGKSPQKNSSNSQDFDLDEIDKFTKKTYFQGFQDQTETKKNILGYLNKNQQDLKMIYDLDTAEHYQFPKRLLNYIKLEEKKIGHSDSSLLNNQQQSQQQQQNTSSHDQSIDHSSIKQFNSPDYVQKSNMSLNNTTLQQQQQQQQNNPNYSFRLSPRIKKQLNFKVKQHQPSLPFDIVISQNQYNTYDPKNSKNDNDSFHKQLTTIPNYNSNNINTDTIGSKEKLFIEEITGQNSTTIKEEDILPQQQQQQQQQSSKNLILPKINPLENATLKQQQQDSNKNSNFNSQRHIKNTSFAQIKSDTNIPDQPKQQYSSQHQQQQILESTVINLIKKHLKQAKQQHRQQLQQSNNNNNNIIKHSQIIQQNQQQKTNGKYDQKRQRLKQFMKSQLEKNKNRLSLYQEGQVPSTQSENGILIAKKDISNRYN